jgi:hypothetical protein
MTNISASLDNETPAPLSTAELLAKLAPLPDVKRPYLTPEGAAKMAADGEADYLQELISGQSLNNIRDDLLEHLPDIREKIGSLGPAGLNFQARPSNTINALTIPTADGVLIVYNLGLHGMLYSFSRAVCNALDQKNAFDATQYLASLVDWATSRAKVPCYSGIIDVAEESASLAANIASRAQRFAICHELGHVLALEPNAVASRSAKVASVTVKALPDSWDREYNADREGLAMYMRQLDSRGKSRAAALIGAEVFFNSAGILQESSEDEGDDHPPSDDRLFAIRAQFREACGDQADKLAGPSAVLRSIFDPLRKFVSAEVKRRRAETKSKLDTAYDAYEARASELTKGDKRAFASRFARFVNYSPGATLDFLHAKIFAPRQDEEAEGGSEGRIFAVNAALHLEKSLQEAIDLPKLRLHFEQRAESRE